MRQRPVRGNKLAREYVATLRLIPITDGDRTYAQWRATFEADPADPRRSMFRVTTTEPMICAIVWGEDESFGRFNNSLAMNGTGEVTYKLTREAYVPRAAPATSPELDLSVSYDSAETAVGAPLTVADAAARLQHADIFPGRNQTVEGAGPLVPGERLFRRGR